MRKSIHFLLLLLLLTGAVISCNHPDADVTPSGTGIGTGTGNGGGTGGTGGGSGGTGGTTPDTALCFERDILPIFISSCAKSGCHDAATAKDGYVFTSYTTITAKKFEPWDPEDTELYEKITEDDEDDRMPKPPNPRLTQQQISLIYNWIARGAPNSTGCATNSGCDTANVTFSGKVQPIIVLNCRGCHNTTSAPNGVNLDNYNGVRAVALDGRLVKVINHAPGVPAMPKGGAKLSDCQIDK